MFPRVVTASGTLSTLDRAAEFALFSGRDVGYGMASERGDARRGSDGIGSLDVKASTSDSQ